MLPGASPNRLKFQYPLSFVFAEAALYFSRIVNKFKMIEQIIREFLTTHMRIPPAKLDQPDLRVADLGVDSLGLVEMLFEVEDRFGFQLDDPSKFRDMKYSEMVASIEAQVLAHNNGVMPDLSAHATQTK